MTQTAQKPVVVGVDGSESAMEAVRWAAREAGRRHATLVLVHVWTPPAPIAVPYMGTYTSPEDGLVEQGDKWLAEATAVAQDAAPETTTRTEIVAGSAAGRLVGRSADAALVVLGSRGLGGFAGLLVGSVAVAVSTHGQCPVVVVRGNAEAIARQDGPVVVGIDGAASSRAAIPFAFEAARLRHAPLVAVHAWSDLPITSVDQLAPVWAKVVEHESEVLGQWLAESQGRYPDVHVKPVVVRDRPTRILLDHAKSAQLVVVGSRGRGGFRGLLLGSTGQALIHHSPCPVAVVPPRP